MKRIIYCGSVRQIKVILNSCFWAVCAAFQYFSSEIFCLANDCFVHYL